MFPNIIGDFEMSPFLSYASRSLYSSIASQTVEAELMLTSNQFGR